jgi:hypothetical protein
MPEGCTDLNDLRGLARRGLTIDRRCRLSDLAYTYPEKVA